MRIIIPGGTGQVGRILARSFTERGHRVTVLGRSTYDGPGEFAVWDGATLGAWCEHLDGADAVINLAGRSVNCRYTRANMDAMMSSRVDSTRVVGEAIAAANTPPPIWLQMSTATIYAHRFDAANDEATGIIGGDEPDVPAYWGLSVDIAKRWEKAQADADTPATRKVALRAAMVMSPDRGGVFDAFVGLVRMRVGGAAARGRQYVSWIHDHDFVRAIDFLLASDDLSGPVNVAAPGPLPQRELMRILRQACGVRVGLPATRWMLRIGALLLRTDVELVLKSRRVVPGRLVDAGFEFEFPDWSAAAADLSSRWRAGR